MSATTTYGIPARPEYVCNAQELDRLPIGTILRLGNGLAAWKRNGLDWYVANDEDESFDGDCIEMCDGALPAQVLWIGIGV